MSPTEFGGLARLAAALRAPADCARCGGTGHRDIRKHLPTRLCHCVLRQVFRACLGRYRAIQVGRGQYATHPRYSTGPGGFTLSFPSGEFLCDCEIVARRALADMPVEFAVWESHCLGRLAWHDCLPLISGIDRGAFFHSVYRMEEHVGQAYLDHGLFPQTYFRRGDGPEIETMARQHHAYTSSLGGALEAHGPANPAAVPPWGKRDPEMKYAVAA